MASEPVEARKRALRVAARRLVGASEEAGRAAQAHVLALSELAHAKTIALYASIADEVPTEALAAGLAARGVTLVFPRMVENELRMAHVADLSDLEAGYRGIREPPDDAPEVAPKHVDVFVVPGLLFDRRGYRLGRGGGHYDRVLAGARRDALRVGLTFLQRVVGELPRAEWDLPVHVLVTEVETFRPVASGAAGGA